jgi:hypothetical protein
MRCCLTLLTLFVLTFGTSHLSAAGQGFVQTGEFGYFLLPDGTTNMAQWTSIVYDSKGNPVRTSTVVSNYGGLNASYLQTVLSSFDKNGELLTSVTETDYNLDGIIDARSTTTHTKLSETQTQDLIEEDLQNDGIIDVTTTATRTFDKQGRLVHEVQEEVYHDFPGTHIFVQSIIYEEDKDKSLILNEADFDGDGIVDVRVRATGLKNQRGQVILQNVEFDNNVDGTIDSVSQDAEYYDKQGNLIQWTWSSTSDFGGTWIDNYSYENRGAVRQQSRNENQTLNLLQQKLRGGLKAGRGLNLHGS